MGRKPRDNFHFHSGLGPHRQTILVRFTSPLKASVIFQPSEVQSERPRSVTLSDGATVALEDRKVHHLHLLATALWAPYLRARRIGAVDQIRLTSRVAFDALQAIYGHLAIETRASFPLVPILVKPRRPRRVRCSRCQQLVSAAEIHRAGELRLGDCCWEERLASCQ